MGDPVLEFLQLEANEVIDNHSNSTVDLMKGHVLPKLRVLGLFVGNSPIFTQDELLFWGDQAGWESLTFLGLYHTQSFIPFVGRTPNLEELWLLPLEGEDTTGLDSHLAGFKDSYPFPALRQLKARSPWRDIALSQQNDRVIPWYLINRLSPEHLTSLDLSRSSHRDQDVTDVPQAEDIARVRAICPNLQDLRLDMIIPWSHEPFPRDIAKELTAFTKPISLTIYLHVTRHPHLGTEALYLWIARGLRWCFRSSFKIARCFLKERESQRIHGQPRFSVNIIWANDVFAENDSIRSAHFHICTVETHQDVSRSHNEILFKHATSNKDIEKMSLDQLKDRTKPRLGNIVGGRARYLREIRRRENLDDVGTGAYEIDATLYDILTASDPVLQSKTSRCTNVLHPTRCPNRMKRRRVSDQGECRMCQERRSSLSVLPRKSLVDSFAKLESLKRRTSSAVVERDGDEGGGTEGSADAMTISVTPKFERRSSTLLIYVEREKILDFEILKQQRLQPRKRTRKTRAITKPRGRLIEAPEHTELQS
ncbi:hypothetical protein J4E82_001155 [Alternaria postmessia]|uniref:uncharacterized protein n=1 Tax=Alternaria postmessia TaxID=1187938 RepID=UPI002224CAFC|nr:uncharacterized protein J4E82_001155 [Alternaria postmessia]KAI5380082.1 hypothetical protein J4E82_001155 [Alternaria postmessia]